MNHTHKKCVDVTGDVERLYIEDMKEQYPMEICTSTALH